MCTAGTALGAGIQTNLACVLTVQLLGQRNRLTLATTTNQPVQTVFFAFVVPDFEFQLRRLQPSSQLHVALPDIITVGVVMVSLFVNIMVSVR